MRKLMPMLLAMLMLAAAASAEIVNDPNLVINQQIELDAGEGAEFSVKEGADKVILDGSSLRALAAGDVVVEAKVGEETCEKTFTVKKQVRVCGVNADSGFAGPVAVWADFNGETGEIAYLEIVGMGHPAIIEAYGEDFAALQSERTSFFNRTAADVLADDSLTDALSLAVKDAAKRFVDGTSIVIRPYQSMAVDRYLANNPHIDGLTENAVVETRIVGMYPEGCLEQVTEDVVKNENTTWAAGMMPNTFTEGDKTYTVTHNVFKAKAPGAAVVEYSYGGQSVLDAVEIYDNFTLYPQALTGSDSYGQVVRMPEDLTAGTLTYRVLGDKAMNFPGGTAGSTVIDVTFDREARVITDVHNVFNSDSTYLANPWEYGGSFEFVGDFISDIGAFCNAFVGMSADEPIVKYTLSDSKAEITGGVVVDGGVDYVVTGATRTPNAIIAGVNAAIEQFKIDTVR